MPSGNGSSLVILQTELNSSSCDQSFGWACKLPNETVYRFSGSGNITLAANSSSDFSLNNPKTKLNGTQGSNGSGRNWSPTRVARGNWATWSTPEQGRPVSKWSYRSTSSTTVQCPCLLGWLWRTLEASARPRSGSLMGPDKEKPHR